MGTGAEQVHVESSSDDELVFLQPQALPVAEGVPSFEGPPATAEEYLARVRYEASQCPAVVRVEYDFKALAETQRSAVL